MVKFKYLKKAKKLLKSIFENQQEKIFSVLELLINIGCYGLVLNLIATTFFDFNLTFFNLIAFGFSWYFISMELPIVVEKYRGRQE